jgi:hypothetical protein
MVLGERIYSEDFVNGYGIINDTLTNIIYRNAIEACNDDFLNVIRENVSGPVWALIATPIRDQRELVL